MIKQIYRQLIIGIGVIFALTVTSLVLSPANLVGAADECESLRGTPEWAQCERSNSGNGGADESVNDPDAASLGTDFQANDCKSGINPSECQVTEAIVLITNVLAAMAATIIVAMVIVGGIQYSASGSDASKIQAAKGKIFNAMLALVLLAFGFSIIQWLVPGGLI